MGQRLQRDSWFSERIGADADAVIAGVLDHIRHNGPTMSRDLDDGDGKKAGPWWGWGPTKAALEYLWWSGQISVVRRENFQKIYDLTERVIPESHRCETPSHDDHVGAGTSPANAFWKPLDAGSAHRNRDVSVARRPRAKTTSSLPA